MSAVRKRPAFPEPVKPSPAMQASMDAMVRMAERGFNQQTELDRQAPKAPEAPRTTPAFVTPVTPHAPQTFEEPRTPQAPSFQPPLGVGDASLPAVFGELRPRPRGKSYTGSGWERSTIYLRTGTKRRGEALKGKYGLDLSELSDHALTTFLDGLEHEGVDAEDLLDEARWLLKSIHTQGLTEELQQKVQLFLDPPEEG